MAFDMGFNCRATSSYVTDPAYAVPVLGELYPHTYTNSNGWSINGGWQEIAGTDDRGASNDPRLAGDNFINFGPGRPAIFKVDLSSGSAPGSGDYTVDLAVGLQSGAASYDSVNVKDNTSSVIAFSGTTGGANHYFDATGTDRAPGTSSWDLVRSTASVTFTTTTVSLEAIFAAGATWIAHFRLTLVTAGTTPALRSMLMLMGVGA